MQITETSADGLKREFKIVVAAQEIDAKIDAKLRELTRTIKLPGFRPGKVPQSVLAQRFGGSVTHEVVENEVAETAERAVSERGLRVAMQAGERAVEPSGRDAVRGFTAVFEQILRVEMRALAIRRSGSV